MHHADLEKIDPAVSQIHFEVLSEERGRRLRDLGSTNGTRIDGLQVIIDPKSLVYLDGTELDFVKEGLNEGFKFNNPNARSECGCGESFSV